MKFAVVLLLSYFLTGSSVLTKPCDTCPPHDSLLKYCQLTAEFKATDSTEVVYLEDVFGPNVVDLDGRAKHWLDSLVTKTELFSTYSNINVTMFLKNPNSNYSSRPEIKRAENIKKYLIEKGVKADRILTGSRGLSFPPINDASKQYLACLGSNIYIKFIR